MMPPWRERQAQLSREAPQPLVVRPQLRSFGQSRRGEQMDVDISDAAPEQGVAIDEMQDLRICGDARARQVRHGVQHGLALTQIAQSEFADDEGVGQNHSGVEPAGKRLVARAKMVDPDGRIDQDHAEADRRRGGASRPGSLPPRRASRRALSRSMRALSASRTRLDFSLRPVKAWALATSSSSSASVVRIDPSPPMAPNLSSFDDVFNPFPSRAGLRIQINAGL